MFGAAFAYRIKKQHALKVAFTSGCQRRVPEDVVFYVVGAIHG